MSRLSRYPRTGILRTFWVALVVGLVVLAPQAATTSEPQPSDRRLIIIRGAAGTDAFDRAFEEWISGFRRWASQTHASLEVIGTQSQVPGVEAVKDPTANPKPTDLEQLRITLAQESREGSSELWLVLIGHGTFDGKEARFNLRGPDLDPAVLAEWLQPIHRPMVIVNCASASGAFLRPLSGSGRVVITSTRSGSEVNATRFAAALTAGLDGAGADLDKDGQVSVLEWFLKAARETEASYVSSGLLLTEHALIDDNGDGVGSPASQFKGLRTGRDGILANRIFLQRSESERRLSEAERQERDSLEQRINELRERKASMATELYEKELEALLLPLARLMQRPAGAPGSKNP